MANARHGILHDLLLAGWRVELALADIKALKYVGFEWGGGAYRVPVAPAYAKLQATLTHPYYTQGRPEVTRALIPPPATRLNREDDLAFIIDRTLEVSLVRLELPPLHVMKAAALEGETAA